MASSKEYLDFILGQLSELERYPIYVFKNYTAWFAVIVCISFDTYSIWSSRRIKLYQGYNSGVEFLVLYFCYGQFHFSYKFCMFILMTIYHLSSYDGRIYYLLSWQDCRWHL